MAMDFENELCQSFEIEDQLVYNLHFHAWIPLTGSGRCAGAWLGSAGEQDQSTQFKQIRKAIHMIITTGNDVAAMRSRITSGLSVELWFVQLGSQEDSLAACGLLEAATFQSSWRCVKNPHVVRELYDFQRLGWFVFSARQRCRRMLTIVNL